MISYEKFYVWSGGHIAQRVDGSKGGGNGKWWNNTKRWETRKKILGYEGRWNTKVDIIYNRDAYKQPQEVTDDYERLKLLLLGYANKDPLSMVLEFGETGKEEFTISCNSPHWHILLAERCDIEELEEDLQKLVNDSCFHSVVVKNIPPNLELQARSYVSKRFKIYDNGTKTVRKECKPFNINTKWSDIKLPVHKHWNIRGKYQPQTTISIDRDLLYCFGDPNWIYRSLSEIKCDLKQVVGDELVFKESIGFDDVNFDGYTDLELLWMGKNVIQYGGDFGVFVEKCPNRNKDLCITVGSGSDGEMHARRWFFKVVGEMKKQKLPIPQEYDNKTNLLYSYDTWLVIKKVYHGDWSVEDAGNTSNYTMTRNGVKLWRELYSK